MKRSVALLASPNPMLRRAWFLGGAGVLALFGQQSLGQLKGWQGSLLYLAAAVLFALAVSPLHRDQVEQVEHSIKQWPREAQQALLASSLLTGLLFIIIDTENVTGTAWILQAAAIALVLVAGRFADRSGRTELPVPKSPIDLTTATTQLILVLILVGGVWVRFKDLGSLPRGFWFDEADVGLLARRIAEEGYRPVFGGPVPAYDAYLIALLSGVFGESITTVRTLSAVFGTATMLAGYLVGRELFGKMGGLVIAFLIAFSRWAITLSRVGMNNVALPLFVLLTLGLALRGHRRQSNLDFALAGLAAGAGMLFYSAIAASQLALALFAAYLAWSAKQHRGRFAAQALIGFVGALVVVTPLAKFVLTDSERYFNRNRNTAIWSDAGLLEDDGVWSALKKSLSRYLPMTSFKGDRNGRHNIPGDPMLPPLISGLSILGLGTVVFKVDRWLTMLVAAWLPLAFAPGVLSLPWEAPNTLRAVAVLPLALILAAAAVFALAHTIVSTKHSKHAMLGVLTLGLGLTGWADAGSYFDANRNRSDVWAVHSTSETITAELIAAAPATTHVQAVAFLRNSRQQTFLSPDRAVDAIFGSETQLPLHVPDGNDGLFFALRDSYDIGTQAEQLYPNADVQREFDGLIADVIVVRVPAADITESFGWTMRSDGSYETALIISETGNYRFRSVVPTVDLVIDGMTIAQCDVNSDVPLAAGLHLVKATGSVGTPSLQWIEPDSTEPWTEVSEDRLVQTQYLPGGLVARHYAGVEDTTNPAFTEVDATLNLRMHEFVLPRPYRTEWTGGVEVPTSGDYEIFVRTDDELTLEVDGETIITNGQDFAEQSVVVSLDEGIHPIAVRYLDRDGRSEVVVRWRPAGNTEEPVPIDSESFVPWLETRPLSNCSN